MFNATSAAPSLANHAVIRRATIAPVRQCINCLNTHLGREDAWNDVVNKLEVEGQADSGENEEYGNLRQ